MTAQAVAIRQLKVTRRHLDEAITLKTDLDRLNQVFINLITNAQKYCDADEPTLTVEVLLSDEIVSIVFADNGTPIPVSSRAVIFEKFARI